ncbi:aminopeptidase [Leptospira ognonensis]|uniref:Aminopeptidase n=1 Tax=Leptospira ognonensis TaxID=2484945 RepID=A0A4R9K6N7_9LEPT|nr:aminopeptidase [Leptospira ognonensis]TGL61261.1 aminopeptidase [Leptospira ognonensis]
MLISPPCSPSLLLCRTKKAFLKLLALCLIFSFLGCIPYLFHVGSEQGRILWHRQKIENIILENKLEEDSLQKLRLITKVREYAISKLALNEKGGFKYFTKLNREAIGWNVSASEPLSFTSYTWWFPIAGTVPYKGFFDKEYAIELENELKNQGLDTRIRVIGGYSTLGWFSDPVLSPQLKWDEHLLVGLVFHEMAHATVYLPGDSDLNESYASFVEEKGVESYYLETEGTKSKSLEKIYKEKESKKQSLFLLKKYARMLDQVYNSNLSSEEKLKSKKEIIHAFKEEILKIGIISEKKTEEFRKREWNNEDFLGFLRYHSGVKGFETIFQNVNRDFKTFHAEIKKLFDLSPEERKSFLTPEEDF